MDGTLLMGGTSADPIGRPLPRVHGRALGEISGTIHVHLREQGRPQGAGFSAGDLSHRSSRSEFRRYRGVPLAGLQCPRGDRHRYDGGDIGRAQRTRAAGGAAGSCNPNSRPLATAALRSGGADRPPRETRCACAYCRERSTRLLCSSARAARGRERRRSVPLPVDGTHDRAPSAPLSLGSTRGSSAAWRTHSAYPCACGRRARDAGATRRCPLSRRHLRTRRLQRGVARRRAMPSGRIRPRPRSNTLRPRAGRGV